MLAFIAIFFPAVIMMVLWERLFLNKDVAGKYFRLFVEYFISVILLNAVNLFITYKVENPENIVAKINECSDFAFIYILRSCLAAISIPGIISYCKANIKITWGGTRIGKSIPWRVLAALYTLILFLLNFIRIFDNNFWGDEGFSIKLSQMTVSDMVNATAGDVHPPLYYLFMIAAYKAFGIHGWVYHMVSLVPYAVGLIFTLTVIWRKFGKETAILLVTFCSILTPAVQYNVEARMYSWAALFVFLAYYAFYMIIDDGKKRFYVFFVLASLGAAYTHYYAMVSVAFFYLALLIIGIKKKAVLREVIVAYLLTIIGYAPWLLTMLSTVRKVSKGFWISNVVTFKSALLFFFSTGDNQWWSILMLTITMLSIIVFVLCDAKIIEISKIDKQTEIRISNGQGTVSYVSCWLLWGVIAVIGTIAFGKIISALIRPLFLIRYIYPLAMVFWLVASVGIAKINFKKLVVPIIMIITLLICVPNYADTARQERKSNTLCEATRKYMQQTIVQSDVMLTNGEHLAWTILAYYMPNVSYKQISKGFTEFNQDTVYWLVWSVDLSEDELTWLDECGYVAIETYHAGVLGENPIHIYQLEKKKQDETNFMLK